MERASLGRRPENRLKVKPPGRGAHGVAIPHILQRKLAAGGGGRLAQLNGALARSQITAGRLAVRAGFHGSVIHHAARLIFVHESSVWLFGNHGT